jgi:hypothetical protein
MPPVAVKAPPCEIGVGVGVAIRLGDAEAIALDGTGLDVTGAAVGDAPLQPATTDTTTASTDRRPLKAPALRGVLGQRRWSFSARLDRQHSR